MQSLAKAVIRYKDGRCEETIPLADPKLTKLDDDMPEMFTSGPVVATGISYYLFTTGCGWLTYSKEEVASLEVFAL